MEQHEERSWYRARLKDELEERSKARSRLEHLSETADVMYAMSRAEFDNHPIQTRKIHFRHISSLLYMSGKYSSRWYFYRVAAAFQTRSFAKVDVREVVNPAKDLKIQQVAERNRLDPEQFLAICKRLRHVWPLLP
eukprot:gene2595-30990_t